jgi:hypothetical protein
MTRRECLWRAAFAGALAGSAALACTVGAGECRAAAKEECLDAHSRGQDLREAGRLTSARQAFLACAQSTCPAVVQSDCARFSEEIDRLVPSVSFAARDPGGVDLPDTTVYVDDQMVTMHLDDGKSYELDPGKHAVRFVHEGRETAVTVVVNQGEKGRSVVATFADAAAAEREIPAFPPSTLSPKRPAAPLFVAGLGAVATIAGVVVMAVGLKDVPAACSVGSKQCVAPPGDPSLAQAHHGVSLANLGIGIGAGGVALLTSGLVWYFLQPVHPRTEQARGPALAPWFGDRSGGVDLAARF